MSNAIERIINKICKEPKSIELEFRNEDGKFMFSITGESTDLWFKKMSNLPELHKTTKNLEGKGEVIVLEAIENCGYQIAGFLKFTLNKGGYIKVISK